MTQKPSKEQLDHYFKMSRKYFDEMAQSYYNTDRDFYNKYIAPYYNNPFNRASGPSATIKSQTGLKMEGAGGCFTIFVLFCFIGSIGLILYFSFANQPEKDETEPVKKETKETIKEDVSYDRGLYYYNRKDYKTAEKYFREVQPGDKNYNDAQRKLNEITGGKNIPDRSPSRNR